jgi:hypothetical protein
MRLNAPSKMIFWISLVLAALGVVSTFVPIPVVSAYAFWVVVVGYIVLAAGTVMKGM